MLAILLNQTRVLHWQMPVSRRYLCFIPLLLTLALGLWRSWSVPPSDFAGYYYGSRALLHRETEGAYDMSLLNDRIAAAGYRNVFVSYAPFPPFTSLIFAPFLIFPMLAAKTIFNCVSMALFLFSLVRVYRYLSLPSAVMLILPVVFFIPLLNNLAFGQAYLLLFALLTEGWLAYAKERRIWAAFLWAAAILFKLFPAFLFLFLLLRKKYRHTAYLAAACAALLVPALWLNGTGAWKLYLSVIIPRMSRGELNDSFTYVFQSAFMLLKRAFVYDGLLNPHPFVNSPWIFAMGMALFKAAILTPAVRLTLREKDEFLPFTVWIAAGLLISPNGSSYALVLLLLPLLALARRTWVLHPRVGSFSFAIVPPALLLAAACAVPAASLGKLPLAMQFPRLYLLLIFYFLLISRGRVLSSLPLFAALAAVFIGVAIPGLLRVKAEGQYVLPAEAHLFICDYTVRDHRLSYTWRDEKGRHEAVTGLPILSMTGQAVALRDNQIWFGGRQLTHSADRKAQPELVNGAEVYYLSDACRGFGFYTLRKVRPVAAMPDAAAIPGSSR